MAADDNMTKWKRWRDCIAQCWQRCLDLALVLWIVRVPLCAVAIGAVILDYTAQAQACSPNSPIVSAAWCSS